MPIDPAIIDRLREIVGAAGYLEQPADVEPYLIDHRRLFRGRSPLVLRPGSVEQVAAIVRTCNDARVGVVPHGGNTSYCGGATPDELGGQIVLSLARLNRIRHVDPLNYTLVAEAGCTLARVQTAAADADRYFPLSLGSEGSCQIGGNLSTNAGGTAVLRYGMARDLVLGIEVVLPDGRILDSLSGLRKDNTGYDLADLFIGAEGTLGVITAATCKLFPSPRTVETAFIAVAEPQAAVELLADLRASTGDCVTTFELVPRAALEMVLAHLEGVSRPLPEDHAWYVLAEVATARSDSALRELLENTLASAMERQLVLNAALAESEAQRMMFWRLRETIPEAQRQEGASIKHDVSVNVADLPRFVQEATDMVRALVPDARLVAYGHIGDGNLHFNLSQPRYGDADSFLARAPQVTRAVHDLVARYGGSFSAEHGIGRLKVEELRRYKSPVALELMRSIKQAFDPNGIMNPGKVLANRTR